MNTNKSFRTNTELWEAYGKIVGNRSKDLNKYIKSVVENVTDINELKKQLRDKEQEKEDIDLDIKLIKQKIHELDQQQRENENNTVLILEKMDTIKNIVHNEGSITEKRINFVAGNDIKPRVLIKECEKENIHIINERQQQTDKDGNIINIHLIPKKQNNKSSLETIIKSFNRWFNTEKGKYSNDKEKFLNSKLDTYEKMCSKNDVDFNEFKMKVLN